MRLLKGGKAVLNPGSVGQPRDADNRASYGIYDTGEGSFTDVAWVPMSDSRRLDRPTAVLAIDTLHRLASAPDSHVYVHCVAGLVRSPTILWLYLIALGVPPGDARTWIEARVPNANAGSSRMVDREHLLLAQMHGLMHFFPHPRPEIIVPFEEIATPG